MLAVHFLGKGKVQLDEFPVPQPAEHEVLVRVMASGVCGSEMGSVRSDDGAAMNGGHEIAGIIEDPNGHPQWEKGDRVGVFVLQGCGKCRWCRKGMDTFCDNMVWSSPGHSQFITTSAHGITHLPEDISFEVGVMLTADGLGVPYGASSRAHVNDQDITCVFGCGPVGLGMVLVQSWLGAHVIAVEPSKARRDLALKMGAWQVIDPASTDNLTGLLKDLTDGIGPDKCFECSGRQDTLDVAMDATAPEGLIMLVGHGPQSIDPQKLIIKRNLTMSGNWVAHPKWYPAMLDMVRKGFPIERLLTCYSYKDCQEAFSSMLEARSAKAMLLWND